MTAANLTLTCDVRTGTFALTTVDTNGYEHVELFTVPANAPVLNVHGMDCVLLRELLTAA